MQVVEVARFGGPEVLRPAERPTPTPGPGEVLVRTEAAGVNFIDIYRREGRYALPLPGVVGEEGAGRVVAVGDAEGEFAVGDMLVWTTVLGSYADHVVVPVDKAVRVPDALDPRTACAALVQGMTAHYLVNDSYRVRPGDTVLVHAAAGGVGALLVQMAKARGARVLGTTSTAAKAEHARAHGADHVLRYDEVDDLAAAVRELTGGEGVHAVYDSPGATTFDASLASLRRRGTLVCFGGAGGPVPPLDIMRLAWAGSITLTRPYLEHFRATRAEFHHRAGEVFAGVVDGSLRITIGGTYPLDQAHRAHTDLAARRTTGKLLLVP